MVPEAKLERTDEGIVPDGRGWFVLNARDARWWHREGRGESLNFTGRSAEEAAHFPQIGVNLVVLHPGEPIGMYHWEADDEDFLILSGEALLLVEEESRPLRQWDFVHTPAGANHIIVGAGEGPCAVLAIGAREHMETEDWGGYSVSELALRHGVGVEEETSDADKAYARFPESVPSPYRDGWLPR
jgi:uncharacterized cupin superfamily protein